MARVADRRADLGHAHGVSVERTHAHRGQRHAAGGRLRSPDRHVDLEASGRRRHSSTHTRRQRGPHLHHQRARPAGAGLRRPRHGVRRRQPRRWRDPAPERRLELRPRRGYMCTSLTAPTRRNEEESDEA
jgi:hypothetical protein